MLLARSPSRLLITIAGKEARRMSESGQNRKCSLRANVFRSTPSSGHSSARLACRLSAKSGCEPSQQRKPWYFHHPSALPAAARRHAAPAPLLRRQRARRSRAAEQRHELAPLQSIKRQTGSREKRQFVTTITERGRRNA
jgi:hypothetical protein